MLNRSGLEEEGYRIHAAILAPAGRGNGACDEHAKIGSEKEKTLFDVAIKQGF